MTFREFTDGTRESVEHMLRLTQPGAVVPALHLDGRSGLHVFALAPKWFEDEPSRGRMMDLLLPTLNALAAERVAWTFAADVATVTASEGVSYTEELVVVSIDRERTEAWHAPLARGGSTPFALAPPRLGAWVQAPPNQQFGLLVSPIQKALR